MYKTPHNFIKQIPSYRICSCGSMSTKLEKIEENRKSFSFFFKLPHVSAGKSVATLTSKVMTIHRSERRDKMEFCKRCPPPLTRACGMVQILEQISFALT